VIGQDDRVQRAEGTLSGTRMSILEIAARLEIGRLAVYRMLEERKLPGVRVGKRWIVTRKAFERWEAECGLMWNEAQSGTSPAPEVPSETPREGKIIH
jgi:excisionase family DNA binding protein